MKGIEDRTKTKSARMLLVNSLTRELDDEKQKNDKLKSDYEYLKSRCDTLYNENRDKIDKYKYDKVRIELSKKERDIDYILPLYNQALEKLKNAESEIVELKNVIRKKFQYHIFWLIVIIIFFILYLYLK